MISFTWSEISRSICEIRALSMASVSRAIVIVPAKTSDTNCLIMSRPRARASPPNRPLSTIWSSRLSSVVCAACFPCSALGSAILASLRLHVGLELRLELVALPVVAQRALQDLIELLVALQLAAQVRELIPQLQQLLERLHLLRHPVGRKVPHALEREVEPDLAGIGVVRELVVHRQVQVRLHAREHVVEIVQRYVDELPVLQLGKLVGR